MSPRLALAGLRIAYGGTPVLEGADLALEAGECVAVVGPSGSGKTTLLHAILQTLPEEAAIEGSVRLDGREMLGLPERELRAVRGARIALVPQEPAASLHPVLRVETQVSEVLAIHGLARGAEARARTLAALEEVGLPNADRLLREVPHRLSGGMRQRVAIAAALAADPAVLLADEPTTALDAGLRLAVMELLARRRSRGMAVLWVTHDRAAVARFATRVLRLVEGRLVP